MLYSARGNSISHNGTIESRCGSVECAFKHRRALATGLREVLSGYARSRQMPLIRLFSGFVSDSRSTFIHFSVFAFATFCSTMKCDDRSIVWNGNPIR